MKTVEIAPELARHIHDKSAGIIPCEYVLTKVAQKGQLTSPEQLDAWLAELEGPFGKEGRAGKLMRALGGSGFPTM